MKKILIDWNFHIYIFFFLFAGLRRIIQLQMTSTQIKLAWGGNKMYQFTHWKNPRGTCPQEQWDPYARKMKSEFSLHLSILRSSLLAQISGSLQEMVNVVTSKSGLYPNSLKTLSGKACIFLNNSMTRELQLGPKVQTRINPQPQKCDGHIRQNGKICLPSGPGSEVSLHYQNSCGL